jgi:large subunit ribosomal protein L30
MKKVRLTLLKSIGKRTPAQRATIEALGLRKTNSTSEKTLNPAIEGMVNKVKHLLKVESI